MTFAAGLARIGTLTYGIVAWDASAQVTHDVSPVYDPSGQEVIRYDHTFSVTGLVAADCSGGNHQPSLAAIRSILQTPGLPLVHVNGGMLEIAITPMPPSVIVVNSVGNPINQPDIQNGPLPSLVAFRPMGANAAYVDWRCRFSTLTCPNNFPNNNRVVSIQSSVTYSISEAGLTTRSVQASIKLWQNLVTDPGVNHGVYTFNPDIARQYFTVATIPHFHRQSQTYRISEDRRELHVSIVDTEIDSRNAYPTGVLRADVRHRVRVTMTNLGQIQQSLSGAIHCPKGASILPAFGCLLELIKRRTVGGIVTDFEFTEDIFGSNSLNFQVSWWQATPVKDPLASPRDNRPDLTKLFELTRLFSPAGITLDSSLVPYSWEQWSASMAQVKSKRGLSGLEFNMGPQSQGLNRAGGCHAEGYTGSILLADYHDYQGPPTQILWDFTNEKPSEKDSWHSYENSYTTERYQRVITAGYEQDPYDDISASSGNQLEFPNPIPGDPAQQRKFDEILYQGETDYRVRMRGGAVRIGREIPRPLLSQVGSAAAKEIDGKFETKQIAWAMDIPIYAAAWDIMYKLPHSPNIVLAPTNLPPETSFEP